MEVQGQSMYILESDKILLDNCGLIMLTGHMPTVISAPILLQLMLISSPI